MYDMQAKSIFGRLTTLLTVCLLLIHGQAGADEQSVVSTSPLSKEEKLFITNVGGVAILTAWGFISWDYGEQGAHTRSEGWFGQDTPEGGADKLAHFYASYIASHGIAALCESWGYLTEKSALYGSLSSFGLMTFIEIGDSFSHYGMSLEDFTMNTLGCLSGYLLYRYPDLGRKIDFRLEYLPDFKAEDMSTDYEKMKFLMAVKLDGFQSIESQYLKFLECHVGYYARGYSDDNGQHRRNLYAGIGVNLSRILSVMSFKKTARIFNYYQVPYTYLPMKWELPQ